MNPCHIVLQADDGRLDTHTACGLPTGSTPQASPDSPLCEDCFTVLSAMRATKGLPS